MDDINRKVGIRIKEVRLERGLSREQVARRVGVTQQCIEKYEKGEIDISVKRLMHISNALNVGITYFLTDYEAFNYYVDKQVKTHIRDPSPKP